MPNPVDPQVGVDPWAERPRWLLICFGLIYKAKIGVPALSSCSCAGPSGAPPYVPGCHWSAYRSPPSGRRVAARVLKETRSRPLGPSTVNHLVEALPTEVNGTAADGCIKQWAQWLCW